MAKAKAKKKATAKAAGAKKTVQLGDPKKTFQTMKDVLTTMEDDIDKFMINEVAKAGRRLRGSAQIIKKACQQFRKEVQALTNERRAAKK